MNPENIAIDEAQLLPDLFPALRVAIDNDRKHTGRFIITGSSSPKLIRAVSESLAGRIGIIEMAPFSFNETRAVLSPAFFEQLSKGNHIQDFLPVIKPIGDIRQVHEFWFKGGYPEPWLKASKRFRSLWMDQYTRTYLYRDVAKIFPGLNENRFRRFIQLLAGWSLANTVTRCSE